MIKITADIFSGRPNPEWIVSGKEGKIIAQELLGQRSAIAPIDSGFQGLGYRGLIVEPLDEDLVYDQGLPSAFRIANGGSLNESKGLELAERLIRSMAAGSAAKPAAGVRGDIVAGAMQKHLLGLLGESRFPERTVTVEPEIEAQTAAQALACAFESGTYNPGFWNDPAHISKNNCYNYATNRRTDTFAQPGRSSGRVYRTVNCAEVTRGAVSDGATQSCAPASQAPRRCMALVIAPGPVVIDFHWYRNSREGFWGHKPGGTPARNVDNANNLIINPQTANRGPYTIFCGFMYTQNKMVVQ